jgi:hypothetical protein
MSDPDPRTTLAVAWIRLADVVDRYRRASGASDV